MLAAVLLVLSLTQAPTPATSATIEVKLVLPADFTPSSGVAVTVSATPIGIATRRPDEGEPAPTAAVGSLQHSIALRVSPGLWRLTAEADGLWSLPAEVLVQEGSNTTTVIRAWPLGLMKGSLATKPGREGRLPQRVDASFEIVGTTEAGLFASTEPCRMESERWECELPATRLTVRLQPEGFVPRYFHDVLVSAPEPTRVGAVLLERGSSIVGKVVDAKTVRPAAGASVQLRSADGEALGPSFATVADQAGYFQLITANPGTYTVHATARNQTALSESFRVDVADDLRLSEPLGLQAPLTLRVRIEPALDPQGMQWRIRLMRIEGTEARLVVQDSTVSPLGRWVRPDLAEGQYQITVSTRAGTKWATTVVDLQPDAGEVEIGGQTCSLRGVVRRGDEPVKARLVFTRGPLNLSYQSDEGGTFGGRIPCREDLTTRAWTFLVETDEWRGFVHGVKLVGNASKYKTDVRLNDSVIEFVAVDDGGHHLAEMIVITVWNADQPERRDQAATSDSEPPGQVTLTGLADGSYIAQAKVPPDGVSEPHAFQVTPTSREQTVELVVRKQTEVSGIVVTSDGAPVPSARLRLLPSPGVYFSAGEVQTDASGRFDAHLPAGTTEVALSARAYGTAFRLARVPVAADRPLTIRLDTSGGRLVLKHVEPLMSTDSGTYVLREGSFVGANTLLHWAAVHGQTQADGAAIFPEMQEGQYHVCRVATSEAPILFSGQLPSRCVGGYLTRGSQLELTVPPTSP